MLTPHGRSSLFGFSAEALEVVDLTGLGLNSEPQNAEAFQAKMDIKKKKRKKDVII